ncbi:MAG: hypothetical protein HY319_31650 [Armatimonadetes bacterium]|nr:hypothetical protein [Armatimonadota bacterium]
MSSSKKLRKGGRPAPKGLSSKVRQIRKTTAVRNRPESRRTTVDRPSLSQMSLQRLVAMIGFGLCGGMLGFLTGANQLAPAPPEVQQPMAQLSWQGTVIGQQSLHILQGLDAGFLGLVVGSTGGFSFFMSTPMMLGSWLVGGLGLWLLVVWGPAAGAVGWMVGYAPFLMREWTQQREASS